MLKMLTCLEMTGRGLPADTADADDAECENGRQAASWC